MPPPQDHGSKSKFEVIGNKFSTHFDVVEEQLKSTTIGELELLAYLPQSESLGVTRLNVC